MNLITKISTIKVIIISLIAIIYPCTASVHSKETLILTNKADNNYYIHLFPDNHKSSFQDAQQQIELINEARRLNALCIVEDSLSSGQYINYVPSYVSFVHGLTKIYHSQFLSGLTSLLQYAHIPVINVECRHFEIGSSILPFCLPNFSKSSEQVWDHFDRIVNLLKEKHMCYPKKLRKYCDRLLRHTAHDNTLLTILRGYHHTLQFFNLFGTSRIGNDELTILYQNISSDFETTITERNKKEAIRFILDSYSNTLIDLLLLHHIHEEQIVNKHTHIFVCAGSGHIDQLKKLLSELGYQAHYDTINLENGAQIEKKPVIALLKLKSIIQRYKLNYFLNEYTPLFLLVTGIYLYKYKSNLLDYFASERDMDMVKAIKDIKK